MKRLLLLLILVISSVGFFTSCKGKTSTNPQITLSSKALSIEKYQTAQLKAEVFDIDEAEFNISDSSIAVIEVIGKNRIQIFGIAVGSAEIVVSGGGVSEKCLITVSDSKYIPVLEVDSRQVKLIPGKSFSISPRLEGRNGNLNAEFEYKSLDENIASVDKYGVITGVTAGDTKILVTGEFYDIEDSLMLDVQVSSAIIIMPNIAAAVLYLPSLNVSYASRQTLSARVVADSGEVLNPALEYVSMNQEVAEIQGDEVVAVSLGSAQIRVVYTHSGNSYFASITVEVKAVPVMSFILSPSAGEIYLPLANAPYKNTTLQLSAKVQINGKTVEGLPLTWSSLSSGVSVTQTGLVTAVAQGVATVRVSSAYQGVLGNADIDINVIKAIHYGENPLLPGKQGLIFTLQPNCVMEYEEAFDISQAVKSQELIALNVLPTQAGIKDINGMVIKLTDSLDSNNYLTVRFCKKTPDAGLYFSAAFGQETLLGWCNGIIRNDGYGAHTYAELDGQNLGSLNYDISLSFDYGEKALYLNNSRGIKAKIIDFDDEFGDNHWSGFTEGRFKLSIYAETYFTKSCNVIVHSVLGNTLLESKTQIVKISI